MREILRLRLLYTALELAHRVEIIAQHRAVTNAERSLQGGSIVLHHVENTRLLLDQLLTLLGTVATTEQALEQLPRVVLHGQRRGRRAVGDRAGVIATIVPIAGAAAAGCLGGNLERRER